MDSLDRRRSAVLRETYLAEITRTLQRRLEPIEAYESIEELRQHLNAMAAAYVELGFVPDEAMRASIDKFGSAKTLGSSLLETCSPNGPRRPALWALGVTALASTAAGCWLLNGINLSFAILFGGGAMPADMALEIATPFAVAITLLAWAMRRWKPSVCATAATAALNLVLCLTIYRTYAALHEGAQLAHLGISTSISTFVLGLVASFTLQRALASQASNRTVLSNKAAPS